MALVYLVELSPTDSVGIKKPLYFCTGNTFTASGITYVGKILQPGFIGQSVDISNSIGGKSSSTVGELIINNSDRSFDYLKNYIFEGKSIIVKLYNTTLALSTATTIVSQTLEQAVFEWQNISLRLQDTSVRLEVPVQSKKYLGTNVLPDGVEGDSTLKDTLKPLLFGRVANFKPVLVNTSKLIYQISSESVEQVVSVMANMAYVSLSPNVITSYAQFTDTLAGPVTNALGKAPEAGFYTFYSGPEGSFIRLGMDTGALTCTAWEKISPLENTASKVILRVLTLVGIVDYVPADFTYLDTKVADSVGIFVSESQTAADIITTVCNSIGVFWGFDQKNIFRLYYFGDVSASITANIHIKTPTDAYGITSFDFATAGFNSKTMPVTEVNFRYDKNNTVTDKGSIAGVVLTNFPDRAIWAEQEFREVKQTKNLSWKYGTSNTLAIDSVLSGDIAAKSEAARVLALLSEKRNTINISARLSTTELSTLNPCSLIRVTLPRFGFTNGKVCILLSYEIDYLLGTVNLVLWGDILDLMYTPSLDLDFSSMTTLPSNITFTRASSATRVNASGFIESVGNNVPRFDYDPVGLYNKGLLLEETRTNLLTNNSDISNSLWGIFGTTTKTSDLATAPDGTLTADKYTITAVSDSFYQDVSSISGIGTYTASIYIHTSSTSTNLALTIWFIGSVSEGSVLTLNPTTGAFISLGGTTTVTNKAYSITNVGNGWFRYSITGTGSVAANTSIRVQTYFQEAVANIVVWGAQLEVGNFATSYIPSVDTFTSRASTATYINSTGLIATAGVNVERLSYNPNNLTIPPAKLYEPAATNLLFYSGDLTNANWLTFGTVVKTANATTAPDGTLTASRLNISASSGIYQGVAFTGPGTISISIYLKADIPTTIRLLSNNNLSEVVSVTCNVTTSWQRFTLMVPRSAGTTSTNLQLDTAGSNSIHAWGAQLEATGSVTSYIPTTTTIVARSADVYTSTSGTRAAEYAYIGGTNMGWVNPSEGTFKFIGFTSNQQTSTPWGYSLRTTGANTNCIGFFQDSSNGAVYGASRVLGVDNIAMVNGTSTPKTRTLIKHTFAYKNNDFGSSMNGAIAYQQSTNQVPVTLTELMIGSGDSCWNGHVTRLTYFPSRVPNLDIQTLSE